MQTTINLPFVTADANGPKHLDISITRAKFEQLIDPIVQRTANPCKQALDDAKLTAKDIDHVVMVGGTTRIPCVRGGVEEIFKKKRRRTITPQVCLSTQIASPKFVAVVVPTHKPGRPEPSDYLDGIGGR